IVCVPEASVAVVHEAVRELPEPVKPTALQPEMLAPLSVNATVPVGDVPVTVAVKVTAAPGEDGFAELTSAVLLVVIPPGIDTVTVSAVAVADTTLMLTL